VTGKRDGKRKEQAMNKKQRIAVVGAGISGLASAWLLSRQHEVTLFEAGDYLGGHTNTVDVTLEGKTHPVDTGFLVFNEKTYPNLIAMFALLGVESVETEMSFAVSLENPNLEWAGSSLATVFGQKRNLVRPQFWSMLSDILRFNRESTAWLLTHPDNKRSLRDFLTEGRYSSAFADWYLLPMAAAIWSCPTGQMRDMPLATFIRFCQNHGLLQVFDRPLWRTVKGGGRDYVQKIAAQLDDIRLACPVSAVTREAGGLRVTHAHGNEHFDQVVMACHSDQTLGILGFSASDAQRGGAVGDSLPAQPRRAAHRSRPVAARRKTLVGLELLCRQRRAGRTAGRRFLPDQQAAAAALQNAGGGDAQPGARAGPGQGDCRIRLRPSDLRRPGHRRAAAGAGAGRKWHLAGWRLGQLWLP
jgi:predicted NAD/FAD-binding protein